ncbi:MAG: hypothetical protein V2I33_25355 [Kangiellaceae bacterium]|nr:hypothetical protein [Kangiellaceae bacterium]
MKRPVQDTPAPETPKQAVTGADQEHDPPGDHSEQEPAPAGETVEQDEDLLPIYSESEEDSSPPPWLEEAIERVMEKTGKTREEAIASLMKPSAKPVLQKAENRWLKIQAKTQAVTARDDLTGQAVKPQDIKSLPAKRTSTETAAKPEPKKPKKSKPN